MTDLAVNLELLARNHANFAHSEREPTSMDPLIRGSRPYFYRWRSEIGMDILTFENPSKPNTAKL